MSWANQAQNEDQSICDDQESEVRYPTFTMNTEQSTVLQIKDQLKVLTLEQKNKLANEMGVSEDFPSIWSGQHWSDK
jgi:hypothetical protein